MAEKKKTTTKKKTTAPKKAAAVVKKKTTTKKPTVKKAVAKKTTTKKTVTKAKTTPKKTAVKKAPAKRLAPVSKTALSFSDWRSVVGKTFALFPSVWWRVGALTVLATLLMMILLGVSVGLILLTTGGIGVLANEYANLSLGGTPALSVLWTVGLISLVFLTAVFVISFMTNIATVLTVKNKLKKTNNNPLKVLFGQSWSYFGRYAWLSVRIFWYILWPVLVALVSMITILAAGESYAPLGAISPVIATVGVLIMLGLLFWRLINIIFVAPVLIAGNKNVVVSLEKGIALVKGNWWLTLWGLFLFFVPIYLIQGVLELVPTDSESIIVIASVMSALLSIFVFAPLSVSFIYLFMLHLSKAKKINL